MQLRSITALCALATGLLLSGSVAFADQDADGWEPAQGDCNDANAEVHPEHPEVCGDQLDNDCNGLYDDNCDGRIRQATLEGGGCGASTNEDTGVPTSTQAPTATASVSPNLIQQTIGSKGTSMLLFLPFVAVARSRQQHKDG